ncbi:MAG: hypothetical protein ACPGVG_15775 [Mycobacterium sp.]
MTDQLKVRDYMLVGMFLAGIAICVIAVSLLMRYLDQSDRNFRNSTSQDILEVVAKNRHTVVENQTTILKNQMQIEHTNKTVIENQATIREILRLLQSRGIGDKGDQ